MRRATRRRWRHLRTTVGTPTTTRRGPSLWSPPSSGSSRSSSSSSVSDRSRCGDAHAMGHRRGARTGADLPEAGVDSSTNGSGPVGDTDPRLWADPASTYDKVASAYAATFLHELDHKPFDREILTRFAAATRGSSREGHPVCDLGCGPGHIGA